LEGYKITPDTSIFLDLTPDEVTLLFYVLALSASKSLTVDEVNILANSLFETAQVLFVIASQRTLLNNALKAQQEKEAAAKEKEKPKSAENWESEARKLQDRIGHLQQELDLLKKQ
jgi:hypothetical protein